MILKGNSQESNSLNITKGLKSDNDMLNNKDIIALNLGVIIVENNDPDPTSPMLNSDFVGVAENLRFYVRIADYLNDYENIIINKLDYLKFEQTLYGMGYDVDSSLFIGEVLFSSVEQGLTQYKIKTNGSAVIKLTSSGYIIELRIVSMLFNSNNRVYRFEAVINTNSEKN